MLEAERPALLVLDTLADMFPGNGNDKAQVRAFVGLLKRLAIKHDCAVVMLAHPSLSGMASGNGTSGNVAWSCSARSRLYLERVASNGHEADQNARILRTMKANYGPKGGEIVMGWKAGVIVADATPDNLDRMAAGAKAERVFMRLLSDFTAQGRHVSASLSFSYAPTVFAAHPNAEGMTKRALAAAMNALFEAGKVVVAEHGKRAKARKHIALAGGETMVNDMVQRPCNAGCNGGCNAGATGVRHTPHTPMAMHPPLRAGQSPVRRRSIWSQCPPSNWAGSLVALCGAVGA